MDVAANTGGEYIFISAITLFEMRYLVEKNRIKARVEQELDEPDPMIVATSVDRTISDALPGLRIEGKPQCHIVAIAKESGEPAASVGCILSRTRTGMASTEQTCALPGPRLGDIVERIEKTAAVDAMVSSYAGQDAARFA